jgi:site-specific DNA-methyltransferase (adenine-specific)
MKQEVSIIKADRYELYHGDCLEVMKNIPDNEVDLVLCDLPYGTTECKWDKFIDNKSMWEHYNRVLKESGNILLFASQPFTTKLIESNPKMFRYEIIWIKTRPTGFANANYRPMKKHENILIFTKASTSTAGNNHATYNPQGLIECERKVKRTSRGYQGERQNSKDEYVSKFTNYPTSIVEFPSEGKTVHPTQKPVDLLEYLIKTYSNEGEVVLDNCMGSGSTGVACVNTNRKFIGIELDEKYFEVAKERIEDAS